MSARSMPLGLVLLVAVAPPVTAQNAVLSGMVSKDSLGRTRIPAADVSIPALARSTRANYAGDYRFSGLAAGRYLVIARAIGYRTTGDSVTVSASGESFHDFVMPTSVTQLDAVVTSAAKREYLSPTLRAFEERRKEGFGHFITEDLLRKSDHQRLSDVILPRFPGMKLIRDRANATYVVSTRSVQSCGGVLGNGQGCRNLPRDLPRACYATIYFDGILIYDLGLTGPRSTPPNLDDFNVDQLAGVEFYGGEGSVPLGFRHSGCGLLLLWTRER